MKNLILTHRELKRLLIAYAISVIILCLSVAGIRYIYFCSEFETELVKSFPSAFTLTSFVYLAFYKFLWKTKLGAWLISKPHVYGVWIGYLNSNYMPEAKEFLRIPIVFVIVQDLLTMRITSFTESRRGDSTVEVLIDDIKTEITKLAYIYEMRTDDYGGDMIKTIGSGNLELRNSGQLLVGGYWTTAKTAGKIEVEFVSRDTSGIDNFEAAKKKWPEKF
ncbi:hypothetical protein D3C87_291840 [compost metagenome]